MCNVMHVCTYEYVRNDVRTTNSAKTIIILTQYLVVYLRVMRGEKSISNYQFFFSSIGMAVYMNVCMHAYVMHVCICIPLSKRYGNIDPGSVCMFNLHLRVDLCVCMHAYAIYVFASVPN